MNDVLALAVGRTREARDEGLCLSVLTGHVNALRLSYPFVVIEAPSPK